MTPAGAWLPDSSAPPTTRAEVSTAAPRRRVPWNAVLGVLAALALVGGTLAVVLALEDDDDPVPAVSSGSGRGNGGRPAALDERRASAALRELRGITQVGSILGEDRDLPTLQVFADVTSPSFALFDDAVLPGLLDRYVRPGRLKIQLRTVPGDEPLELDATQWTQAAGLQTRLWHYARVIAAFGGDLATAADLESAGDAVRGLDVARLGDDNDSARIRGAIERAERLAREAKVSTMPAFVVTDGTQSERLSVPRLSDRFAAALSEALRRLDAPGDREAG